MAVSSDLQRVITKLKLHSQLEDADCEAILALPIQYRDFPLGSYLIREGDLPAHCAILLSGFAIRHKVTGDGARQIMSIHLPGDFLDLHNIFLDISDHNVQALTRIETGLVPRSAIRELATEHPNVGRAMWTDTLVDGSIFREWVVNIGRRSADARIAHLLCEFAQRLQAIGLAEDHRYQLPMTQEQLADAVGLTPVHVNRVLKELGERGLIRREKRAVIIEDWERLSDIGDFSARYLHAGSGNLHSA